MLMHAAAGAQDAAVHAALHDQLTALLPPTARIAGHGWRPWASASFAGARHWFDCVPGPGGLETASWTEREWMMAGCFVADVAVVAGEPSPGEWRIEMLTVDD